jgi:ubiquinol-cytochrome c reductase cytochrome b subunit
LNTVTAPAEPKPAVPAKKSGGFTAAASNYIDERTSISTAVKELGRKIFPDHWSFLLGEVALYSFVIILLSGTFLTFFFDASMAEVHYDGSYVPLKGVEMSAAMASTLDISFDIRGGLLMRQVHHWAALLFVASIGLHMLRIFFTGAFRKPRELNWVIGFILFILAMAEGFTGYSLPDDLLSGNGLRIIDGMVKGIPLIGTWTSFLLFGGEFPGTAIVGRLYSLHILLLPAIILVLIALHLLFVVVHKHTQYAGPGRTQQNVVGFPILPVYAAKAGGFFFIVFGVVMLIASLFTINPVWNYGPYDPSPVSAGTQPDWYIGFADGILRLAPPHLDVVLFDHTFSFGILIPLGLVGLFIMLVLFYPFIEAWITGDKREHHILDRPRNAATRTAIGAAGVTFYAVLWAAASSDIIATHFKLTMEGVIHTLQVLLFLGPVIAYFIAKRTSLALQKKDRSIALHGYESGRIVRLPGGEYIEVHEPVDDFERWKLVSHESYQPLMIRPDSRGRITVAQRARAGPHRPHHTGRDRVLQPPLRRLNSIRSGSVDPPPFGRRASLPYLFLRRFRHDAARAHRCARSRVRERAPARCEQARLCVPPAAAYPGGRRQR